MEKRDCISLLYAISPNFFEREDIRGLPEELIFEEMLLPLAEFDMCRYDKKLEDGISFGFYTGDIDRLKKTVERVDRDWPQFFREQDRVYCGYAGSDVASFCLVEDMGTHEIGGCRVRIGGPGCVGTLPEHRCKGIGLTMVRYVTKMLKEQGYDYSYIHYTGVAPWYEKLGYRTCIKWNRNGVL